MSGGGSIGGCANIDTLCDQNRSFGVTLKASGEVEFPVVPSPLNYDFVIVAHELGHNFGSRHTHETCPPIDECAPPGSWGPCQDEQAHLDQATLMSYCGVCPGGFENFTTWFHEDLAAVMRAAADASCLEPFEGVIVTDLGHAKPGRSGTPELDAFYRPRTDRLFLEVAAVAASAPGVVVWATRTAFVPFFGGTLVPAPDLLIPVVVDASGALQLKGKIVDSFPDGLLLYAQGWFVDSTGGPVATVDVVAIDAARAPTDARGTTDAAGRYALAATTAATRVVVDDAELTTVLAARAPRLDPGTVPILVVAPRLELRGNVVEASGMPVADATVQVRMPADLRGRIPGVLDFSIDETWRVRTDADGRFTLQTVPRVDGALLRVDATGFVRHEQPLPHDDRSDLAITLTTPIEPGRHITGVVVDAADNPVEDAVVAFGVDTTRSGPAGQFTFDLQAEQTFNAVAARFAEIADDTLVAVKPGYLPGMVRRPTADASPHARWSEPVRIVLGGLPLSIAGFVVNGDGEPVTGARVWIADPDVPRRLRRPEDAAVPSARAR